MKAFLAYVTSVLESEDEYAQNEVHAILFCQNCELRKYYSYLLAPTEDFSAAPPYLLHQ